MNSRNVKSSQLSYFLGIRFVINFLFIFSACLLGVLGSSLLGTKSFNTESLFFPFGFATAYAILIFIYYWYRYSNLFLLFNNDALDIPQEFDSIECVKPYKSVQLDQLIQKLEASGLVVTYVHQEKCIVKVQEAFKLFYQGCGAVLYPNDDQEALVINSFSLDYDHKKRLHKFSKKISELIEN